jgi:hypothetical protein
MFARAGMSGLYSRTDLLHRRASARRNLGKWDRRKLIQRSWPVILFGSRRSVVGFISISRAMAVNIRE